MKLYNSESSDKERLLESSSSSNAQRSEERLGILLKYGSLGFLILQNSSQCVRGRSHSPCAALPVGMQSS